MNKISYKLPPLDYNWWQELTMKKPQQNVPSFAHLIYAPPAKDGWVRIHPNSYEAWRGEPTGDLMPEWLRTVQRGSVKMLVGGLSNSFTTDMAHLANTGCYNCWLGSIDADMAAELINWFNGSLIDADMADKKNKLFYTVLLRWRWMGVVEAFVIAKPDTKTHTERMKWANQTLIPELLKLYEMKESADLSREKALLDMRKQLAV
jgi:hypothetical protein